MSDDPRRWLDGRGDATDAERDLLRSDGDVDPPGDAHGAVWAGLAARLPSPVGGGEGAGGAATATSGISGLMKGALALVVGGAVVGVAVYASRSSSSAPSSSATSRSSAPVVASPPGSGLDQAAIADVGQASSAPEASSTRAVPPAKRTADPTDAPARARTTHAPAAAGSIASAAGTDLGTASANVAASSSAAPTPSPVPPANLDALRGESTLLTDARTAVRRGETRAALASLELARSRYPHGALVQEREVLTIEALAQSGDADGASRRAAAFLRAFPSTPHAAHVRTFVR